MNNTHIPKTKNQLVPIRRFSAPGLYSTAYLSQLVQRGKLRARKVGRNYCTTRVWFEEYLRINAVDKTRIAYLELFKTADIIHAQEENRIAIAKTKTPGQFKLAYIKTAFGLSIAVLVVFMLLNMYNYNHNNKGQIAGEEETATTTEQGPVE